MFATQILDGRPHLPIMTNHPKQGGIATFLAALAGIYLAGKELHWPQPDSSELSEAFRAGPIEAHNAKQLVVPNANPQATSVVASNAATQDITVSQQVNTIEVTLEDAIAAYVGDCLAPITGYPAKFCSGMVNLRTLLNLTDADINKVIAKIANECETDSEYDVSKAQVAGDLARWIRHPPIRYMTKSATRVVENKPVQSKDHIVNQQIQSLSQEFP